MPLRDTFHSPVNDTHSWDEVHGQWPGEIVRDLRNILPAGFRAAPNVHLGSGFEIVTTYEAATAPETDEGPTGTLATLAPTLTVEADLAEQDEYEVRIYDAEHGRVLVAAIEIVSPSNKDRPASREVFVGKLTTLLQQGICVSVVDLVSAPGQPVCRIAHPARPLRSEPRRDPRPCPPSPSAPAIAPGAGRRCWMPGSTP
jgi:hypothetical protein